MTTSELINIIRHLEGLGSQLLALAETKVLAGSSLRITNESIREVGNDLQEMSMKLATLLDDVPVSVENANKD